mmetsp:Transcript_58465/g.153956  ORF Transcript_58465/g.153956 Transcript_58465/m.153956 type:complete len:775 (+) Transcript_58465:102-2426(+)
MVTKSAVIGIDIGASESYVAYVGKGIVDCVQNEVSKRATSTMVGFTDRERLLGDSALAQIRSNAKNTCRNFKHLLGRKLEAPDVQLEHFWSTCPLATAADGFAGYDVTYKGESKVVSAVEVTAMYLTKLKELTEKWCDAKVTDVVIAVPSSFADLQRQAVLDAAHIAGVSVLRLINEHTATALAYGIYRSNDFDPEKPMTVAFCSMGHSLFSVSVVEFVRGKLTVVCEKSAKVGGRDLDECLMREFGAQFQKKTGNDPLANKKSLFKLEDAVGKTKKVLSSNSEASVSCECMMDDHDFGSNMDREIFLEMCKPMMQKVNDVLESAKASCGLAVASIDSVEICGGASRVPWVKEMCSKAFGGKELSTTMNADECVARGCTLQAALLSPLYKVKEFVVEDTSQLPIQLGWENAGEKSAVVFPEKSLLNLKKVMTFFREDAFEIKAAYAGDKALLPGLPRELGSYTVQLPRQAQKQKVKVRASLTLHGTFQIESAQLLEEEPEDAAAEAGEETGKRKRYKRTDLAVSASGCPGLAPPELDRRKQAEDQMISETREIIETNARKNDLESYILTMRSHIDEGAKYGAYIKAEDRATFADQLAKAEEWLWDHMDDPKQVFVDKLAELKVLGGPVEARAREAEGRPELEASLKKGAEKHKAAAKRPAKKMEDNAKRQQLDEACDAALKWLADLQAKQAALAKHEDPALDCAGLEAKIEELAKLADSGSDGGLTRTESTAETLPPPSPAPGTPHEDLARTMSQASTAAQEGSKPAKSAMDVD